MDARTANIAANGERRKVELPCTVATFLKRCGWRSTQVVVEYNGHVLPRSDLAKAELQDGDRLEIIVPVAGG